ncbi:Thioredoxin family protein [Histomonas meleagridis]|uniref:Thioredoxin family protein n=1 Tax=Histomonas meleagridis TaxID=135588 RepID=UPI00355A9428|nr:Thioredoxin family protein [Histomonas meleagridis]KAH0801015.1 Thioredoxin family protein [Histomonas meleagridis]
MLNLLFILSSSLSQLTDREFKENIINGKAKEPWFVMFTNENCPNCIIALPEFEKAAELARGFVTFSTAQVKDTPEMARRLGVYAVPSFFLFTENGVRPYSGRRVSISFLNFIADVIGENIDEADESWNDQTDNRVILFTKRFKPPFSFVATYSVLKNKGITFGISRDSDVIEAFGNPPTPSIWFLKDGKKEQYKGKQDFTKLIDAISQFYDVEKQTDDGL